MCQVDLYRNLGTSYIFHNCSWMCCFYLFNIISNIWLAKETCKYMEPSIIFMLPVSECGQIFLAQDHNDFSDNACTKEKSHFWFWDPKLNWGNEYSDIGSILSNERHITNLNIFITAFFVLRSSSKLELYMLFKIKCNFIPLLYFNVIVFVQMQNYV